MSTIDPQIAQQIVQFLATYGTPAGIAAATTVGAGTAHALGSGATKAIQSLWGKIRHKSEQEGRIAQKAVSAFEAAPHDTEHQQELLSVIKLFCSDDPAFTDEIMKLFHEIQRDPVAGHFIQYISGNEQIGIATIINHGSMTINQSSQHGNIASTPDHLSRPSQPYQLNETLRPHQLRIELGYAYMTYGLPPDMEIDDVPTLTISALNVGIAPSYVHRVEFETKVDGHEQVNGLVDFFGTSLTSRIGNKIGEAIQPGQKHMYYYHFTELGELGTLGRKVIPVAVRVFDEIKNMYRQSFPEDMSKEIMKYYRH